MSAELALRSVLLALWNEDIDVRALLDARIFDRVPTGARFPYVQMGETQAINEDTGCGAEAALQIFLDVHVFSREPGFVETYEIASALRKSTRNAVRAGRLEHREYEIGTVQMRDTRVLRDPDGLTSHGVVTFEAIIDPKYED